MNGVQNGGMNGMQTRNHDGFQIGGRSGMENVSRNGMKLEQGLDSAVYLKAGFKKDSRIALLDTISNPLCGQRM